MYDTAIPSANELYNDGSLDSPASLQSYCLDYISENLDRVCVKTLVRNDENLGDGNPGHENRYEENTEKERLSTSLQDKFEDVFHKDLQKKVAGVDKFASDGDDGRISQSMRFAYDLFLPAEVSEELMGRLCNKGLLDDVTMTLFDAQKTRLRRVKIPDASRLSVIGLRILKDHKISELEVNGLTKATVTELIGCLNEWTLNCLKSFNIAHSTFVDRNKYTIVVALSKLRAVTSLNVSWTEFHRSSLEMVVEDLPFLEHLDISYTRVSDISALRKAKSRLKSLSMYEVKLSGCPSDQVIGVLVELGELRHLDISVNNDGLPFFDDGVVLNASDFLEQSSTALPNLTSLDMSGKSIKSHEILATFLDNHPSITFVGLMLTDMCNNPLFAETSGRRYKVTGSANEAQIMESLKRYPSRPQYVQKSLNYLFQVSQGCSTPRVDMIKVVLNSAKRYKSVFPIQMAATACLYNLSSGDSGSKLHPSILKEVVSADLDAMEAFPQYQQLQKNILLTICSDRILQDVTFDRFRCARLVMDCLCAWKDNSMNKMCVAICSILAAKITTSQTSQLGSRHEYMNKLLSIVGVKKDDANIDITLKFTLSALWNLTDESPTTCRVFLDVGGMDLFLQVLEAFPAEMCIETKVLGLLNNIAEVAQLRKFLMVDHFLNLLRKLMHSKEIEVSYFAAGIAAHLSSDDESLWTETSVKREEVTKELAEVVTNWRAPVKEMVAYRSFRPFLPLMAVDNHFSVQLWAVWAINHVCSNDEKRYCPMLSSQGVLEILSSLHMSDRTHQDVRHYADRIILSMKRNGFVNALA